MPKLSPKQKTMMKLRKRNGPAHNKYNLRSKTRKPPESCKICGEGTVSKHQSCKSIQKKRVRKRPFRRRLIKLQHTPCVICLDTSKAKQNRKMKCGHVFHVKCINNWLKCSDSCPVCRFQLRKPCVTLIRRLTLSVSPFLLFRFN